MQYTRLLSNQSWRAAFTPYHIPPTYRIQGIVILGYPVSIDERGYPVGEKKHGATLWQNTEREALEHYLVKRSNPSLAKDKPLTFLQTTYLFACSRLLKLLVNFSRVIDKSIFYLELKWLRNDQPK